MAARNKQARQWVWRHSARLLPLPLLLPAAILALRLNIKLRQFAAQLAPQNLPALMPLKSHPAAGKI